MQSPTDIICILLEAGLSLCEIVLGVEGVVDSILVDFKVDFVSVVGM